MQKLTLKEVLEQIPDGTVPEKIIEPTSIVYSEVIDKETGEKKLMATVSDGKETFEVYEPVCYDLVYYWRGKDGWDEFKDMSVEEKNQQVQKWMQQYPKKLKLQFAEDLKTVISVRSPKAKQINWKTIYFNVFKAAESVYGKLDEIFRRGSLNSWTFKVPIKSDLLQVYIEVYGGQNIGRAKNRSIQILVRGRTISPIGDQPPCLNWCTFKSAATAFGVPRERITDAAKLGALGVRVIHTDAGISKTSTAALKKMFVEQRKNIEEALTIIDKYVHQELSDEEIEALIKVYAERFKLPKYVVDDVKDLVKEKTIWGLSNAFSFFRTHCEYKRTKVNREEASLTRALEFAAGELITVAPILVHLKQKAGKLTEEVLKGGQQQ